MAGLNDIVPIQPLSLPDIYTSAARFQNAQTSNQLAQIQLANAQRQQGALQAFANRTNPDDFSALNADPQLMAEGQKIRQGTLTLNEMQQKQGLEEKARAATRYLATDPSNQDTVWQQEISNLRSRGYMGDLEAQSALAAPTSQRATMARGIIAQMNPQLPQYGPGTPNMFGQPVYTYHDPVTQSTAAPRGAPGAVVPGQEATVGGAPIAAGGTQDIRMLSGQDFKDALRRADPGTADELEAILDGRAQMPPPTARTPRAQFLAWAATHADPNFDAVNYQSRFKTRQAFTSGQEARNITSLNTVMGHFDTLDKAITGLNNSDAPLGSAFRHLTNPIVENLSPDYQARLRTFEATRNAVADEMSRVFKGAGISDTEIQEWKKGFSATDSPTALHASVKAGIELMDSRLHALGDAYSRGMGTTRDPLELLSPKARDAYLRLTGQQPTGTAVPGMGVRGVQPGAGQPAPQGAQGQNANLPRITGQTQQEQDAQYDALPPGRFLDPKGQVRVKAGPPAGSPKNPYSSRADAEKPGDYVAENGRLLRRTENNFFDRWEDVGPALKQDSLLGTR